MATGKTYNSIDSKEQLILVQTGKGKFGGYKQYLLVNTLNEVEIEFYVCTQCKGVMRNACQVGEEQIPNCETCVGKKVRSQPMMKARQKISQLKANCPLATRGCQWNATLSEVERHLDVCQEFLVKCDYDCGVILKRCELNNHCSNECLNREVSCEHCLNKTVYKDLNRHYEECLEFPLLCPNSCGVNLRRKQTDSHIETDCPNTIVKCRYERFGCKEVIKRCEMEEHNKTNEIKHLEMTTLFAVAKIEHSEETNTKLSKEVNRVTEANTKLSKEVNRLTEANTKLSKEVNRLTDKLELSDIQTVRTIQSLEAWMLERENNLKKGEEQQSAIIESLAYPVVLRDTIKERNFNLMRYYPTIKFEISWRFINLKLKFGYPIQESIPVFLTMEFNKVMSPLAKWPFEGRFKLTIIDRVNTNNSPVYESPVVKLQPKPEPEQGFNLKEQHPNQFEIARIPKNLIFGDRFRTESGHTEFVLQIQEDQKVGILYPTITLNMKELP